MDPRRTNRRGRGRRTRMALDQHIHYTDDKAAVDKALQDLPPDGQPNQPHNSDDPQGMTLKGEWWYCNVCKMVKTHSPQQMKQHLRGSRHRRIALIAALQNDRATYTADKDEVRVTSSESDDKTGDVKFDFDVSKKHPVILTVHNDSPTDQLTLHRCELLKYTGILKRKPQGNGPRNVALLIGPGQKLDITFIAKSRYIGTFSSPLAFFFTRESDRDKNIHILRFLLPTCTNRLVQELRPTAPYRRPARVNLIDGETTVEDGLRPPQFGDNKLENNLDLKKYAVPDSLRKGINHGLLKPVMPASFSKKVVEDIDNFNTLLQETLTFKNYAAKFSLLLWIEELQMEVDIRKYDQEDAVMTKYKENKRLLALKVPGLAENRPSVLRGDHLFVRKKLGDGKYSDTEYKGYVHAVGQNEVYLGFSSKLMQVWVENMKFSVRFVFSRLPKRLEHRAVKLAEENSLEKILFPQPDTVCKQGTIPLDTPLRLYDRNLEQNREQAQAVRNILAGISRPAPYLIFGPPGTGKTVTVVEAMKQVIRKIESSRILACAPSNSAADLLAERLLPHLDKREIFRMNAVSREYKHIPEAIWECCNYDKNEGDFYYPERSDLEKYRVIVCTYVTAGRIASANFPSRHFSHVFLDEAGHAVEPEAVIALANIIETDLLDKTGGQVVLAGDPEQLGPVLRSPLAVQHGLSESLLGRLMHQVDVYKRQGGDDDGDGGDGDDGAGGQDVGVYDPRLVTKLVRNYRSHPTILKVPNECFYFGELQVHANRMLRESMCQWEYLPKKEFPIVFHGVSGKDEREEQSPSWFNAQEAVHVLDYIEKLMEMKRNKVKQAEIGVVTPYRKQVQKIQKLLKKNYSEVKVGSVEEFQGQERKVIIVSTVRSNPEYMSSDVKFNLGFLSNPKRFNVTLTRAKALLIVLGNPHLLSQDKYWNMFLEFCRENGAYCGCDFGGSDDAEYDQVLQTLHDLRLTKQLEDSAAKDGNLPISQETHVTEPQWRSEH